MDMTVCPSCCLCLCTKRLCAFNATLSTYAVCGIMIKVYHVAMDHSTLHSPCSDDANQTDAVLIELKQKGFLWDSVIASVSAPLKFVPYSSQVTDGPYSHLAMSCVTMATCFTT